jgi:hypothetical protein
MIIGTTNLVINEIGAVFNVRIEGDTDANLFYTDATNDKVGLGTASPAEKLDVVGKIKLSDNLVIGTSGKGIDFSITSHPAGMTSELLADYEEGTWTPTVVGTSTAGTASYGTQSATYTKIGRMVYFQFELIWNSGTGTGFLRVAGLPYTCAANNCSVSIGDIENVVITALYNVGGAYVGASSNQVVLREFQVGGGGNNPITYDAAGTLRVGGCYFV